MTRAQAVALSAALESREMPHAVQLTYPSPGVEQWNVNLDPTITYAGADVGALATYCSAQGLTLSIVVQSMGVV